MMMMVKTPFPLPHIMTELTQKSLNMSNPLAEKKKIVLEGKWEKAFIKHWLDSYSFVLQLTFIYNICLFIYV